MGAVKCVLLTWTSTCMKIGVSTYVCFVVCGLSIDPTGTVFNLSAKFYTSNTSQPPPPFLICASLPMLISFVACTLVTDKYSCLESTINTFFLKFVQYTLLLYSNQNYITQYGSFLCLCLFFYSGTVCLMCIPSLLCFYNHQY